MGEDHVRSNRGLWDELAESYVDAAVRNWASSTPTWGVYGIPEERVHLLPDLTGLDVVELGCGTAYVSAWLLRRGARSAVGLDNSGEQLATAQRMQHRFGLAFPLVHADAERVPLRSAMFDVAISEYGAAIWCDPYRWIPEAARLLRPGGRLVFLGNSTLLMLCAPDEDGMPAAGRLLRPQRGMHRFEWPDDPGIEFHLSHGDMVRLLRANGFEIEDLIELYPGEGDTTTFPAAPPSWARNWPCEEIWVARKRA